MHKKQRKELDGLWKKQALKRAGKKCEKCGSDKYVQVHHIIPRTNYRLRWDLENAVCLCRKHHLYWAHKDAREFSMWIDGLRDTNYLDTTRHFQGKQDYFLLKKHLEG